MATHDDATAPSALALLRGREVELVLAVRPWHVAGLGEVVRRVAGEGVALSLWPMLSDEDGRFLHAGNVARMRALVTRVLAAAMPSASALKPEPRLDVMLDLEPPVDTLRALAHWRLGPAALAAAAAFAASERNDRAARALVTDIQRAGATVSVAVMPHVVLPGGRALSRLAAVPTLAGTDSVDLMLYRTLAQGYARGLVSRQRALRWLGHLSSRAVNEGMRIALGCVGTGALGDEATYSSPADLADDVRVARGRGATAFALFEWSAILRRGPAEAWLDAVLAT